MNLRPKVGDKVNDSNRIPNANGIVTRLIRDDGEVSEIVVRYDDGVEFYDKEDFEFTWTDKYGGVWVLGFNH